MQEDKSVAATIGEDNSLFDSVKEKEKQDALMEKKRKNHLIDEDPMHQKRTKFKQNKALQLTDEKKSQPFERKWSNEDEVAILEAALEYKAQTGLDPKTNMSDFHRKCSFPCSIPYTLVQLKEKVRRIKENFRNKEPSNPHQEKLWELCKRLWPGLPSVYEGANVVQAKEYKHVKSNRHVGTSSADFLGSSANMFGCDYMLTFPPLFEKLKGNSELKKQLREPHQKSIDVIHNHKQLIIEALNTTPVNELELYWKSLKFRQKHKELMMEVLNTVVRENTRQEPTHDSLYHATHQRNDGSFVFLRSRRIADSVAMMRQSQPTTPQAETVGGAKKGGKILGFGSDAHHYFPMAESQSGALNHRPLASCDLMGLTQRVVELEAKNAHLEAMNQEILESNRQILAMSKKLYAMMTSMSLHMDSQTFQSADVGGAEISGGAVGAERACDAHADDAVPP